MTALLLAASLLLGSQSAAAAAINLFADGFEERPITPLFKDANGAWTLPPGPVATQLDWLLSELAPGETTSTAEVTQHFDPGWLAQINAADTASFIQSIRNGYPNAVLHEPVTVTPLRLVAVLRSPDNGELAFLRLGTRHGSSGKLVQLGLTAYSGTVQYPEDQQRNLAQAVTRFNQLSSAPALLVAQLDAGGSCRTIVATDAAQPRAMGSVFKLWILAALARAVSEGSIWLHDALPLTAAHVAPGGILQQEPLGTSFSILDLARMMMGVSDNTATDMLLAEVGRAQVDAAVEGSGVADPSLLTPMLGINEQFHLFYTFPLATSLQYVNGSDAFQQAFIANQIAPLGPLGNGPHPYFNVQLLTDGSWRASAEDICATLATLHGEDAVALELLDRALGASAVIPGIRSAWDRVWFKGGSLASASNNFHVYASAWLLQRSGQRPYVVVMLSNSSDGGIDQFDLQSLAARIVELVGAL